MGYRKQTEEENSEQGLWVTEVIGTTSMAILPLRESREIPDCDTVTQA